MFIEYENGDLFNIGETAESFIRFLNNNVNNKKFRVNRNKKAYK